MFFTREYLHAPGFFIPKFGQEGLEAVIELQNLTKRFETPKGTFHALDQVSLSIEDGDIFGIIGISGAGKSTLIRCINLLERPEAGKILIDGNDITQYSERQLRTLRRNIGMVFQQFHLLMQLTILENVMLPMQIAGVPKANQRKKALELLELVGLLEQKDKYPAQLSGGQQQRVSIARALANDPKVLLCDEPTSALDPLTTSSVLHLLKDIHEKLGVTIVIITHQIEVVQKICNRMAVIDHAVIAEQGDVQAIFQNPQAQITKQLLGRVSWHV